MKSKYLLLLCAALSLFSAAFIMPARATTIAWTNTSGGSWNVAANWKPNLVPGVADDVLITSNGTYTVIMTVSPSISSLTLGGASGQQTLTNTSQTLTLAHASVVNANGVLGMNGGIVNGAGALALNGLLQWNGGNTGGGFPLSVMPSGVLNLQSSLVFQGAVTNFGTVNWLAGSLAINTNSGTTGVFWNQAGAVFDIQCSQSFFFGISLPTFHNAGLIRKEIATGITTFGVFLDNSGTVQAKAGTILFPNGSNLGGAFQADNGAAITFTGGTYTLSSSPNFQGPGPVQLASGNLTLNTFTGAVTLNGIGLVGQNTVSATGTVNFNGSNLNPGASLTVISNGVVNLQSGVVYSGPVTNFGTVNWLGGTVAINTNSGSTGVFWNQAGAVFDIQCSQSFFFGISLPTFYNAGLIRKEVVSGITTFGVFLVNSGTVQAKAGTIQFPNGSNLGGTFQADSGAAISFNGGAYTLSSPPGNFQGPGLVQFTSVNLTLNAFTGTYTLSTPTLLVGQNTIAATGTVNLNGCNTEAGSSLTVLPNGVLNLQNSVVFQGAVTNQGTVNWLSGTVAINTNGGTTGVFWNQAGAVFDIQCSQSFFFGISLPTFHNAGLLRKSATSGSTAISVRLENTGTIQAQIGVIDIQGAYVESLTANLAISLGGLAPGTGFGKIQFSATPAFAGKFTLDTRNGYRPNLGNSFQVISYPSFSGGFTSYNGLDLGGGLLLTPQLSATSLTLTAAAGTSLPNITGISLSGANAVLNCINGQSGQTNTALMSTNVAKPLVQWTPVATNVLSADGNFTITLTNVVNPPVPQRYFILKLQ